jgi:hypothetical protein
MIEIILYQSDFTDLANDVERNFHDQLAVFEAVSMIKSPSPFQPYHSSISHRALCHATNILVSLAVNVKKGVYLRFAFLLGKLERARFCC